MQEIAKGRKGLRQLARAGLKKAFRELRVPVCGRFCLNEGGVAGYGNRMKAKYTANWGLQIAEMLFQTRSHAQTVPAPLSNAIFCALRTCSLPANAPVQSRRAARGFLTLTRLKVVRGSLRIALGDYNKVICELKC